MAVLSEVDRQRVWRGVMRYLSNLRQSLDLSKTELRAAVDATDIWIEDNQADYNNALPTAAKANLTIVQKTLLFCVVAAMRVSPAFARLLLGEVT